MTENEKLRGMIFQAQCFLGGVRDYAEPGSSLHRCAVEALGCLDEDAFEKRRENRRRAIADEIDQRLAGMHKET